MQPDNPIHQTELESYCRQTYQRIGRAWQELPDSFITKECRFSILYGPPILRPDIMIIGTNPGYNPADLYEEEIYTWPNENEYWAKNWALAKKLRKFFSDAGIEHTLKASVGTNFLFFKSRAIKSDGKGFCWEDNPKNLRDTIESICLNEVRGLVERIKPKIIVVLGLGVFDKYCLSGQEISSAMGRVIGKTGTFCGVTTIGIMHPTGARISNIDMAFLVDHIKEHITGISAHTSLSFQGVPEPKEFRPHQRYLQCLKTHDSYAQHKKVIIATKPACSVETMLWVCFAIGTLFLLSLIISGTNNVIGFLVFVFICLLIVAGVNPILFALDLFIIWILWSLL